MLKLIDDEYLDDIERWARHNVVEKAIGRSRVTDLSRRGGPGGKHDLEADLPGRKIAAIEITSEADGARRSLRDALKRHLSAATVPGSQLAWLVNLTPQANAKALSKSAGVIALITDMEQQGELSLTTLSDYRHPLRCRLKDLGVQSVYGFACSVERRGDVYVVEDIVGGWGWVRATADKWISDFFASELGRNHLAKLERAQVDERHLIVVIDSDTDAGLGIGVALTDMPEGAFSDDLPTAEPPAPLTRLWLMPAAFTTKGFCWTNGSGWAVVDP
jgi:hypothetical protein